MKVHHGKTHKYLGMLLDFSHANQDIVTMIDYADEIVVAYDKALTKLSDGFSAVKKKSNIARTSAAPVIYLLSMRMQKSSVKKEQLPFTILRLRLCM